MSNSPKRPSASFAFTSGAAQCLRPTEPGRRFWAIDQLPAGHKSVFVYGPQGCGKTRNSQALAKHFGLAHIHDGWDGKQPVKLTDTLVLTHTTPDVGIRRKLKFDDAMACLKLAPGYPF